MIALLVLATYCNLYDQTARDCEYISIIIFKIFIVHEKSTSRSFHYDPGLPDATDSKRRRAKMRNQKQNQQQKFQETEQQEPWNWGSNSGSGKRKERKLLYRIPPKNILRLYGISKNFKLTYNILYGPLDTIYNFSILISILNYLGAHSEHIGWVIIMIATSFLIV